MKNIYVVFSAVVIICVLPVSGAVLRVGHGSGYDYTTITAALDAANAGDTVTVAGGTYRPNDIHYPETFPLIMKSGVTLIRESDDGYPEINADKSAQVFRCENTVEGTRIEGFIITGGNAHGGLEYGGGIFLDGAVLSLTLCEIRDCQSDDDGGGVFCASSTVVIDQCRIISNKADSGGGIMAVSGTSIHLSDTVITNNQASLHGGGITGRYNTLVDMVRCDVSDNSADNYGGGLTGEDAEISMRNCVFAGNISQMQGGGFCVRSCRVESLECLFSGNESTTQGGGVAVQLDSNVWFQDCMVYQNTASEYGGGIFIQKSQADIVFSQILENVAAYGGGGLYYEISEGTVASCLISANQSSAGGGIDIIQSNITVANNLFHTNEAIEFGGAVSCREGAPMFQNCTITGNTAWDGGGALFCFNASPIINDCILWNNTINEISQSGSSLDISYSDVQGGFPGTGNFDTDPLFVSSSEDDYFLSQTASGQNENSPCVNAGSTASLSISFTACEETFYMDQFTTRTDMQTDISVVDVGYHYHPTRPECRRLGCTIEMPSHDFGPGDTCSCDVMLCNPDPVKYEVMPVFVLLDVYGSYFFAPSFSQYDHYTYDVFYGQTLISVLPAFAWPPGTGDAQGIWFHACITNHGVTEIVGLLDSFQFGYHD